MECVYVQVTNVRLKTRAPNQPAGLPENAICLPSIAVQVDDPVALPANVSSRKSVRLTIKQVPLRQAIVLTTYSIQGVQFPNYIIRGDCTENDVRPDVTRHRRHSSFTFRRHLDKAFAKAASPSAALAAEMTRLQDLHETTKGRFERARCPRIDTIDDEPPAKRLARNNSTSSSMSLGSESSRSGDIESSDISGSLVGSESSQSDDSGSDESGCDGSADERDE